MSLQAAAYDAERNLPRLCYLDLAEKLHLHSITVKNVCWLLPTSSLSRATTKRYGRPIRTCPKYCILIWLIVLWTLRRTARCCSERKRLNCLFWRKIRKGAVYTLVWRRNSLTNYYNISYPSAGVITIGLTPARVKHLSMEFQAVSTYIILIVGVLT